MPSQDHKWKSRTAQHLFSKSQKLEAGIYLPCTLKSTPSSEFWVQQYVTNLIIKKNQISLCSITLIKKHTEDPCTIIFKLMLHPFLECLNIFLGQKKEFFFWKPSLLYLRLKNKIICGSLDNLCGNLELHSLQKDCHSWHYIYPCNL